jgi:hypothetical protein
MFAHDDSLLVVVMKISADTGLLHTIMCGCHQATKPACMHAAEQVCGVPCGWGYGVGGGTVWVGVPCG